MAFSSPLVSVVVPAFNGERTIIKTVSSILMQKHRPLELIVIDDGSKDSTASVVTDYLKNRNFDGIFSLVQHKKNMGLSITLNDGVTRAHGDYVLVLHQDCEFVGDNWISKALSLLEDRQVAIVTGYYGLSDLEDETFVKRAFGVLRKQFHARPALSCEEATFSEGKSDLYRKDYLLRAGGFPTGYRIAGEDLVVSYKLRSMGYDILKCYDLAVIQRFTGAAESFSGNLGKEFLFGKVMGGVFSEFKLFLFKRTNNSSYSGSRSLHRASQPLFVLGVTLFALFSIIFSWWLIIPLAFLLLVRYVYYEFRVYPELKNYKNPIKHPFVQSLATAFIGIPTDFAYTFGFVYGFIIYHLRKRL